MRRGLALLLLVPLVLGGCTTGAGKLTVSGVAPASDGALNLTAGRGMIVTPSAENHTLVIGLAPVAQTSVFHACADACRNFTVGVGSVIAEGDLVGFANLTLIPRSGDSENAINFATADGRGIHFLRWSDAQRDFQLNGDLIVGGNLTATQYIGTRTPLVFNAGTPNERLLTVSTAALEGTEVTVFARGSANLTAGTATITLPQAFQAVTDAGGLTVQVTLTSDGPTLYVSEKRADHFTVRGTNGSTAEATFDWFAQAPRKGASGFVV